MVVGVDRSTEIMLYYNYYSHDSSYLSVNGHATVIEIDPRNPMASLENNPNVPRNCTITRPPPITRPGRSVFSR